MELIFRSRYGTARLDWSQYALLRDNVQHYLESGPGQARFEALHAVEHAVDGEPTRVNALGLRSELQRAWAALAELALSRSAVSLRTRALLTGCDRAPLVRGTVVAKLTGWSLPLVADDAQLLRDRLAAFVEALLGLTECAVANDDVLVVRASHTDHQPPAWVLEDEPSRSA
jgi:hypothetical protein